MRPALLDHLDAHWAARLQCDPIILRNHNTNIITHPQRVHAEVWLFDKTCVIAAGPALARVLKASVGTRSPGVAFEPGRLREAVSEFGLEIHGPESIMVYGGCPEAMNGLHWLSPSETESELGAAIRGVADTSRAIPLLAIPLKQRLARRAAEACGFELYANVIFIGDRPNLS